MGRFVPIRKLIVLSILAFAITDPIKGQTSDDVRTLTPDDLFRLESIENSLYHGSVLSPDGNWLAFVLKRSKAKASDTSQQYLLGSDRADIWLASTKGGAPINLTKGALTGKGFWRPIWSPDSERILALSNKSGNVTLWVIERASGKLKQVSPHGIELWRDNFAWLSNHLVVVAMLPAGKKPLGLALKTQTADIATREWQKHSLGTQPTASILDSGEKTDTEMKVKGSLIVADVSADKVATVARGDFFDLNLSPDKRHVAAFESAGVVRPPTEGKVRLGPDRQLQLAIFSSVGHRLPLEKLPGNLVPASIRWAPDGTRLAVMGLTVNGPAIFTYRIGASRVERAVTGNLEVPYSRFNPGDILWSSNGDLVTRAKAKSQTGSVVERSDWWLISENKEARNLTASMQIPTSQLVPERNQSSFVGIVGGKAWRVFTNEQAPVALTLGPLSKLTSIAWPNTTNESRTFTQLIVAAEGEGEKALYKIDLGLGEVRAISKPDLEARIISCDSEGTQCIMTADASQGTSLWLARPNLPQTLIVQTNGFLKEIREGGLKKIEYRGMDGQMLKAWLLLPPDYSSEKRYPLVTWVYAGTVVGDRPDPLTRINNESALNLQLLAARGYIVLLPSMPLKPTAEASDPYLELTKGVLPAVEKAIDSGYADPFRLGVMGHSFGGYSTYGLVSQTNRFKAAISLAGLSDLISLYGMFDARFRYDYSPHERLFYQSLMETGQARMGNSPWKDGARYLRNSPIFYADRVQTPLMIIQGDMDYVSITQGEEFFTALYRQGKRARFIRYWGEGHLLESPANIRDMWHRVFAWFDEFLDIARDPEGSLTWEGNQVKSRKGAPPLKPEDFGKFDVLPRSPARKQTVTKLTSL